MKIDVKKRWRINHHKYKLKHLKHEYKENKSKEYKYPVFDYLEPKTKRIINKCFDALKERGINKKEATKMFAQETGMTKVDFQRKFIDGSYSLPLWEFMLFLKVFDFKINLEDIHHKSYQSSIEKDRLIITKTKIPRMSINMNINDLYDFEADLSEIKAERSSKAYFFNLFNHTLKHYFLYEAGNKKLPYTLSKMKAAFYHKIATKEVLLNPTIKIEQLK